MTFYFFICLSVYHIFIYIMLFYKAIHFNLDNLYSCVICLFANFILALFISICDNYLINF